MVSTSAGVSDAILCYVGVHTKSLVPSVAKSHGGLCSDETSVLSAVAKESVNGPTKFKRSCDKRPVETTVVNDQGSFSSADFCTV